METAINFLNQIDEGQRYILEFILRIALFLICAVISPLIGRSLPSILYKLLRWSQNYTKINAKEAYRGLIQPFQNAFTIVGTLCFLALCLNLLINDNELYTFLGFFIYFGLAISIIWFALRVARPIIRQSVITLVQRRFGDVGEAVLIFETLIYILIVLFAIVLFAQGLRVNLIALGSLGVIGAALAFAAQQALGRLIGTIELYLDRPYVPGEYVRVTFNPYAEDIYGRIESIGLRSTKIRIVARNTLMIVPNSMMAGLNIENVSRGKKIMAMVCLDFSKTLQEGEQALVKRTVEESCKIHWGFDKTSVKVQFSPLEQQPFTRARVVVFITGSGENSLGLRKRLLELANDAIASRLAAYNLRFTVPEPMVYIDSPMSI